MPYTSKLARTLRFADFFSGIGGFHIAARNLGLKVVFAGDIDEDTRRAYTANFGFTPMGDIASIESNNIPDHDLLFAGFPCQPFSIIGNQLGFSDPRGTLRFHLIRIISEKNHGYRFRKCKATDYRSKW